MEQNTSKAFLRLRILISGSCILCGLLAGENTYRYGIEVPAWRHLDMATWAEYSRHADLKNGAFFFPFEAIIGTILLLFASIIIIKNKVAFKKSATRVHMATFFALAGLVFTFFAAPYMLSVRTIGTNEEVLQQTFDHFHFWGTLRAIAQILSFFFCVFALGKVYELKFK